MLSVYREVCVDRRKCCQLSISTDDCRRFITPLCTSRWNARVAARRAVLSAATIRLVQVVVNRQVSANADVSARRYLTTCRPSRCTQSERRVRSTDDDYFLRVSRYATRWTCRGHIFRSPQFGTKFSPEGSTLIFADTPIFIKHSLG